MTQEQLQQQSTERLARRHAACGRAFDKLADMHDQYATPLNVYCLGRRIMLAVRRVRAKAMAIHQEIMLRN